MLHFRNQFAGIGIAVMPQLPGEHLHPAAFGHDHRFMHRAIAELRMFAMIEAHNLIGIPAAGANGATAIMIETRNAIQTSRIAQIRCAQRRAQIAIRHFIAIDGKNPVVAGVFGGQIFQRTKADKFAFYRAHIGVGRGNRQRVVAGAIIEHNNLGKVLQGVQCGGERFRGIFADNRGANR